MLSVQQKKDIFIAVLKSYSISSKTFTPSVIYTNQIITTYPVITLNYLKEEMLQQYAGGDYLGGAGYGQLSLVWLSINVLAKDGQGLNANVISKQMASQLSADIRANWKSLSDGTIKFTKKSDTNDLTHIEQAVGTFDVARQQFDVYLQYQFNW